jgi:hypothetical protein
MYNVRSKVCLVSMVVSKVSIEKMSVRIKVNEVRWIVFEAK